MIINIKPIAATYSNKAFKCCRLGHTITIIGAMNVLLNGHKKAGNSEPK